LCGLPGDDEYAERLTECIKKLRQTSVTCLDAASDHVFVLAGDEPMAQALELSVSDGVPTSNMETVSALARRVRQEIAPQDSLWVFLLGHADLQGRSAKWNVAGTDPDQRTFAKWFQGIQCREKVFWITTPLSGFYIRNLSAPGTVVITATEPDLEISATDMPYALADILAGEQLVEAAGDRDEDGQTSLLDLYLAVCHEVSKRYAAENLLKTEHALIDDNGDRRGTELQQRFLPEELGGQPSTSKAARRARSLDGGQAAQILLPHLPVAPPPKPEEPAPEEAEEPAPEEPDETEDAAPADQAEVDEQSD
ncbi:MAG: hypothetical protein MI861_28185, partial [Pirellulales bacterium]|nr:hypothetical protein [Pirellulales bacterium]